MRIFVGNLAYTTTEDELDHLFAPYGVVERIQIMTDRSTGRARGFGFVEINDDAVATQAVQSCNGRALMGRTLVVNEARPPERRDRSQSGGGGGRQRDFGGSRNRW